MDESPDSDDAGDETADMDIDLANVDEHDAVATVENTDDLGPDDIQDPELRRRVKQALDEHGEPDPDDTATPVEDADTPEMPDEAKEWANVPDGDGDTDDEATQDDDAATRVKLSDGDGDDETADSIEQAFANGDADPTDEDTAAAAAGQHMADAVDEATDEADDGLLGDVDDTDVEDAMDDMELDVRDDIDPAHYDFEEQSFDDFSSYGEDAVISYNGALFHFVSPSDDDQTALINEMQTAQMGGGSQVAVMETLIDHVVERPDDIESRMTDWSPFERLGLGLQCLEFLGLNSLGNF